MISDVSVRDVRFPTSLEAHGSDAMHKDPDYSAAYVVITVTGLELRGHGLTFTLGRGTDVVVSAIRALLPLVVGKSLLKIYTDFGSFWRTLTNESQLRWIGPEKGAVHLAVAAVINALWDLWGKIEQKPVWKLLCDMTPEEILTLVDFRYLSDVLTKEDARQILSKLYPTRSEREAQVYETGYPAYTTSIGWLGYVSSLIPRPSPHAQKIICSSFLRVRGRPGYEASISYCHNAYVILPVSCSGTPHCYKVSRVFYSLSTSPPFKVEITYNNFIIAEAKGHFSVTASFVYLLLGVAVEAIF